MTEEEYIKFLERFYNEFKTLSDEQNAMLINLNQKLDSINTNLKGLTINENRKELPAESRKSE